MRIDSSSIGMESQRTYSLRVASGTRTIVSGRMQSLAGGAGGLLGNPAQPEKEAEGFEGQGESSEQYMERVFEQMRSKQNLRTQNTRTTDALEMKKQLASIRQQCLDYLMDLLFYPVRMKDMSSYSGWSQPLYSYSESTQYYALSRQTYYEERENTAFQTQGTVKCADGREISFDLNLSMSRSFQTYYEENYQAVHRTKTAAMCDPLVINLDGNIAELSDQTFFFDIDGDGKKDEINRLAPKSGYLALDKNGDGVINDGTELFGTKSGNGFADLAAYDTDGNGFIDEGDEIFNKLKIWITDENGHQQLVSLADKGVGAICLQNIATDFDLTGQDGSAKGRIRNTGIFLYESGAVGSVQHVDVAKYNQAV